MPEYNAGDAKLRIIPDASNFIRDLEADLKRRKAEFAVQVAADTTRATADMDRFRVDQERRPVKIRAEVDKSSLDQIKKGLGDAGTALGGALKTSGIFALVGTLPAAATAITNVAGAIQQLAGAGAVLPGVFAGVAADVGTVKLALMGVGDAFKAVDKASDGSAKNIAAANEALAKLAPQAADFVKSVESLKPAFQGLQRDVQGKFFTGLGEEIKTLAQADLPLLQKGLGGIATAFNQNLKQLGGSLSSGSTQGLLDRILGNTGDAQARLSKTIDPIIHAFGTLAATGSDTLPRLADGVGKLADRFDHFISAAADSGKLSTWINDGITGFDHLGNTLLNLGKIVTDLTGAAGGDGGLLKWLDQGSSKLQTFLSSTQGQETLRKFFADGREEIKQLVPILENLGPIATAAFSAARDAAGVWLPVLKDVTDTLAKNPQLVRDIADAFLAWKFVGVISGVSDAVKGLSAGLGLLGPAATTAGAEAAAGLAPLLAAAAPIAALAASIALITGGKPQDYVGLGPNSPGAAAQHGDWGHALFGDAWPGSPAAGQPKSGPLAPPPTAGLQTLPGFTAPAPAGSTPGGASTNDIPGPIRNPALDKLFPIPGQIPGHAKGGPTPSGRGNGPTGGWISELHGNEWVLPAHARSAVGDKALWALTSGRSFAPGGYIDQFGNPITPGPSPGGPGPIAPAPGGGGVQAAVGSFLSGIGGPIGNIAGLIQGGSGKPAAGSTGTTLTPGFAGLAQAGNNPDLLNQWGTQTGDWLGNFGAKTLTSFATTLWSGALGFFGLQNSILSPNNPWFQDASKTAGFFLGQDGPLAGQGQGGSGSASDADLAALQQSGVAHLAGDRSRGTQSSRQYPYVPGTFVRPAVGKPGQPGYTSPIRSSSGSGSGAAQWGPLVAQIVAARGLGPGWVDPLLRQIQTESGGNPGSINAHDPNGRGGTQTVEGLFNFLPSTFAGSGGKNIWDPADQINTAITYVQGKYGQSGGVPNHIGVPGQGFSYGGAAAGRGGPTADTIPAMLSSGEHVFTAADVAAMGGQGAVYNFRKGLHRSAGGPVALGNIETPGYTSGQWTWPYDPNSKGPYARRRYPEWWRDKLKDSGGHPGWWFPGDKSKGQPLGYAYGGIVSGLPVDPFKPFPRPPDAQQIIPRPVAPSPSTIGPPPLQPPAAAPQPPIGGPPPEQPQPQQAAPVGGPAPTAGPPSSYDHNLPWVNKAIDSTATVIGNIAQTAAAVGTFGAAGLAGGGGGGGGFGGPSISGAIQQAGKIVKGLVNVGSSFLVGNVTPGTTANAYGETLHPQQNVPQTAPLDSSRTYVFHGVDSRNIVDDIRTKDAQDQQATLARYG